MHPFYDGNGRTCHILFANDDEIIKPTDCGFKKILVFIKI